jgi:PAS domain S-box-containing protein
MGALMRAHDWSTSPIGYPDTWPQALRSAVGLMLANKHIMFVAWGPDLAFLYNDAYRPVFGQKHPWALGRPFREIWSEVWDEVEPLVNTVLGGEATWSENLHLVLHRNGYPEDCWFTFSYSPVREEHGAVVGLFCAATETTVQVLAQQRQAFRLVLEKRLRDVADPSAIMDAAVALLGRQLGANRVGYGEVQADDVTVALHSCYADGVAPLEGAFPLDGFGPAMIARQRQGLTQSSADVNDDPDQDPAVWAEIDTRAFVSVPLVRDGRFAASLYVNAREPHAWTADEIALIEETAGRTWSAVEHARAEAALRESESQFRAFVNATATVVYRMSPDWREMRRLDGAGFIVDTEAPTIDWVETYIPADERPRVRDAIERAIADKELFELEHLVLRADGTVGWTHSRAIPLLDNAGGIVEWFGAASDVTARVKADQSFTRLFEASPAPFLVLAPDAPRFTITEVNDAYLAATMRTREGVIGRGVFEAYPDNPDDATLSGVSLLRASLERVIASRRPDELPGLKYDVARPDGTFEERWWSPVNSPVLDENGEVEAIIHNANDVTEDRRAEAALRESEHRYHTLFESLDQGFCVFEMLFDGEGRPVDYVFVEVNPAFEAQTGLVNAVGRRISELAPGHEQRWYDLYGEVALTGTPLRVENVAQALGRWYEIYAYRVGEPEQRRVAALFNDVSERKRDEARIRELNDTLEQRVEERTAELKQAQEALRQSQKLEAMGQLTGGVAHDFNNLLTPIVGGLDMLVRRGVGSERERRLIAGALQSAERATILVQRLLAFARRQPLQPVAVDISRLVEGMVGMIGSTLGPTIDVRVVIDADLQPAKADPNQLEMALLNLAVNARDAMPDGGELTVKARRESVRPGHASGLQPGDYVLLSVVDTGAGMDDATRQRAIEPFFSTKGVGKGTGLGLSMVHGLAAQLGGMLTIDSTPGKGTTIELWLPASTAAIGVEEASTAAPETRVGRGVVLLVDDEELVRMSTADMLIDLGFEVVEAGTAEEALRLLKTGTMPDILITDHLMPGMTGVDLAREARAVKPTLRILIVSGYAEVDGVAQDLPRLNKPFRIAELAESISALLPVDG